MANRIQLRRDTAANWTRVNPVLEDGEPGLEIDTNYVKYGDGNTAWVDLAYASTGGGGSVSFDYSTVQEGTVGFANVTSITGNVNTGVSLTSDEWAQLMWVPSTANTTIANIASGPATYTWAYVDNEGFHVENKSDTVANTWIFHANSLLTTPGNVQVGNVGLYGNISFVNTISANNYVFANGVSILTGISGNTGSITFDGIKIVGADVGSGSGDIELVPDNTGTYYSDGQYIRIYPTRAVPDAPHIHIAQGYGGDLILGDDQRGVDINHDSNVYIRTDQYAGAYNWRFGSDGILTLPGEGVLQSIDDSVSLSSFNTGTGFANSVYLGTSGGLGFNDQSSAANWLEIFRSGIDPDISTPGNLQIRTDSTGTNPTWLFGADGTTTFPDHQPVTITGNLTVGNLIVTGNSSVINTESYVVADNIIQMANANPADTLDLGFVAHRTVNSTLEHTGLIRNASTGKWYLFSNVTAQPSSTVDLTNAIADDLVLGTVQGTDFKFANGVSILSTIAPSSSYGDSNVEAYIGANIGAFQTYANATFGVSSYGNTEVAAYLLTWPTVNADTINVTNGNITTLRTTNFSTGNAVITGGYATGLANVTVTGNVTVGNLIGTQYGNTVGTTATYTGNVTVGNILGTTSNTSIVAGAYTSTFDTTGQVSVPNITVAGNVNVTGGEWREYIPVWTSADGNGAIGNGLVEGRYKQIGKIVHVYILISFGSTTNFGAGEYKVTLPVAGRSVGMCMLNLVMHDTSTRLYNSLAHNIYSTYATSTSSVTLFWDTGVVTHNSPFTWVNGDYFVITGTYEAAS